MPDKETYLHSLKERNTLQKGAEKPPEANEIQGHEG